MNARVRNSLAKRLSSGIHRIDPWGSRRGAITAAFGEYREDEHAKFAPYYDDGTLRGARKLRQHIYYLFHDENYNKSSLFVLMFIIALIILSTIFYIVETVPAFSETKEQRDFWETSELIVTLLFTIEYILRIITVRNRCGYIIKPMNVVDLLAVLPYYVEKFLPQLPSTSLRVLRIVRLARLGRLRNLFSEYIEVMSRALWNAAEEAGPMMFLMIMLEVVLFGSSVYAFENGNHKDGSFASIPDTMWWAFVTMTTVGYGDLAPITNLGRLLGVFCMFSGIVLMAICVIIIGGNFEQVHQTLHHEKIAKLEKERLEEEKSKKNEPRLSISEISASIGNSPLLARSSTTSLRVKRSQMQDSIDGLKARIAKMEDQLKTFGQARHSCMGKGKKLFPWLGRRETFINDIVVQKIMECFTDEYQFHIRGLNLSFYNAYFKQNVKNIDSKLNFARAVKLAAHGRVFHSLQILVIGSGEVPSGMLRSITATYFPKLEHIRATNGVDDAMWWPSSAVANLCHTGVKELEVNIDGRFPHANLLAIRFPKLTKLEIIFRSNTSFTMPSSHKYLEEIHLKNCCLEDYDDITSLKFPKLRKVNNMALKGRKRMPSLRVASMGVLLHDQNSFSSELETILDEG